MRNRSLPFLLDTWNCATAPYVYRTEREHKRESQRARAAMALIRSRYTYGRDYKELSNGALVPVSFA